MLKIILFAVFLFLLLISLPVFSEVPDNSGAILGNWLTREADAKISIYKEGKYYYGYISWLKNPTDAGGKIKADKSNQDKSMRNRPVMGLVILKNFEYKGNNKWTNGLIYDPRCGRTARCNLTLENENTLKVRGYIGIPLFGKTEIWTRVVKQ